MLSVVEKQQTSSMEAVIQQALEQLSMSNPEGLTFMQRNNARSPDSGQEGLVF